MSLTLINPFKYENEKVNKFPKNIGLKNTFKNFLWKKKKLISLIDFFIFHKNNIKTF